MQIRRAYESELPELFRIQLQALQLTELLDQIDADETPAVVRHGFDTGNTIVAVEDHLLAGFAVGYERDGTWFLGEFFVRPDAQSARIGQALLATVRPDGMPTATMATSDYRAQALYARFGMTPLWPSFNLRGDCSQMTLPPVYVEIVELEALTPEIRSWDADISGRRRPEDLRFLLEGWRGSLLWIEREGEPIGYAGIARRGAGRVSVGPVGVRKIDDAAEAVIAVIHWAASQHDVRSITIDVPGPHPALSALLVAGFRITDQNLFCASDPARFGDPLRYLPLTPAVY